MVHHSNLLSGLCTEVCSHFRSAALHQFSFSFLCHVGYHVFMSWGSSKLTCKHDFLDHALVGIGSHKPKTFPCKDLHFFIAMCNRYYFLVFIGASILQCNAYCYASPVVMASNAHITPTSHILDSSVLSWSIGQTGWGLRTQFLE